MSRKQLSSAQIAEQVVSGIGNDGAMELTDGVVKLRTPTDEDAQMVVDAIQVSIAHLQEFMTWASSGYDIDQALGWIRGEVDPGSHAFIVFDETGRMIGSAGLNRFDTTNNRCDVGYWLRPDATGKGYATRATNLLLDYAVKSVGINRVEILMSVENEPSRQVAERSAATYEGIQRGRLKYGDRYHDAHVFVFFSTD